MKCSAVFVLILSLSLAGAIQAQQSSQSTAGGPPIKFPDFPAPINLKVLPRNLTGQQVHDLMDEWSNELGVRCIACHIKEPEGVSSDGTKTSTFAEDTKPMKGIARLMYAMTEKINSNFIATVEGSGMPVTCGTCHRGNISPEPFTPPSEHADTPPPAGSVATAR